MDGVISPIICGTIRHRERSMVTEGTVWNSKVDIGKESGGIYRTVQEFVQKR